MEKKYKITALKDFPILSDSVKCPAGTTILNVTQKALDTGEFENTDFDKIEDRIIFRYIYNHIEFSDWFKVEEDNRCNCLTRCGERLVDNDCGYMVELMYSTGKMYIHDSSVSDHIETRQINYCPWCGRKLANEREVDNG